MRRAGIALVMALAGCATTLAPLAPVTQPIAQLTASGVTITLTKEPCALTAQITNLPYRATWSEAGGGFDGCYDVQLGGLVVMYFSDRTEYVAPLSAFGPPDAPAEAPSTGSGQARPISF